MTRPYRECPACGKHALSIATRCPQCGHELSTEPIRRPASRDPRQLRMLLTVGVVLLAGGGLLTILRRGTAGESEARTTAAVRAEAPDALENDLDTAAPAKPDSAAGASAVPRRARTWTKVHARRSVRADVVAVLLPGDTVLADSLRGGWWRVALEGRVIGYVYAPTLAGN
jgi:hypothetical protein